VLWVPRSATLVGAGVEPGATVSTGTGVMADTAPATTAAPSTARVPQLLTVLHTHTSAQDTARAAACSCNKAQEVSV
jgi:hypothetical protein